MADVPTARDGDGSQAVASPANVRVAFQPVGRRVEVPAHTTAFDAARVAGIELASACGGTGKCGMCKVKVAKGDLGELTPEERFLLTPAEQNDGLRLACRHPLTSDTVLTLTSESTVTGQRLQVNADLRTVDVDPMVRAWTLSMEIPTLKDFRSDLRRVADAVEAAGGPAGVWATPYVVRSLSPALRANKWQVTAYVRDRELLGVAAAGAAPLGLAVDLGSTKIAAQLLDLATGEVLGAAGAPNPQISYGEDVITRLEQAYRDAEKAEALAARVGATLDELVGHLVEEAGQSRAQVVDAVIVGNTAMAHLLARFPVEQLVKSPFVAASGEAVDLSATELGIDMAPGAHVYLPATVGGFVGGDHVAMALATDLATRDMVVVGIDIGTNTELSLAIPSEKRLLATSSPSGPAFEGAHIRDGMRAASGAIEKIRISPEGEVDYITIDDAPAVGICGSGILDAVAELYTSGMLNKRARMEADAPGIIEDEEGTRLFELVPAEVSGTGRAVAVTQWDVNEIQLAKGAISAAITVLLRASGTPPEAVDEVIIAGAFGSFLSIPSSLDIGLFPKLPNAHYRQVGNAALVGAQWMLISAAERRAAQDLVDRSDYLELTVYPGFNREFALAMFMPPIEKEPKK